MHVPYVERWDDNISKPLNIIECNTEFEKCEYQPVTTYIIIKFCRLNDIIIIILLALPLASYAELS